MDAVSPEKIAITIHQQHCTSDLVSPTTVAPSPLDQFCVWLTDDPVYHYSCRDPISLCSNSSTRADLYSSQIIPCGNHKNYLQTPEQPLYSIVGRYIEVSGLLAG